jgi:hypothetical protein
MKTASRNGICCLTTAIPCSSLMSSLYDVNKLDSYKGDRVCPSGCFNLRTTGRILINSYTRVIIRRFGAKPSLAKYIFIREYLKHLGGFIMFNERMCQLSVLWYGLHLPLVNYYDEKLFASQRAVLIEEAANKKWILLPIAGIA